MSPTPVKETLISKLAKALAPQAMSLVAQAVLKNLGGFQLFVAKLIIKYGGRQLIEALNTALANHDRQVAQEAANKIREEVKQNPNSTPDDIGHANQDYFNSGRRPSDADKRL